MFTPTAYGSSRKVLRIISGRARSGRPRDRYAFWSVMLVLFIAFVLLGAWLVEGVASVGRADNDCLNSGRQVCGVFKSW